MIALPIKPRLQTPEALLKRLDFEPLDVLPLLTIVLALTATPELWYLRGPLVIVFALGVVYRHWLRTAALWYVVATLLGTAIYLNWETTDNHKYLLAYWCLALCAAFSLPGEQQPAAIAASSRWLISLCMLLAVAWKLAMPDYRDGTFFEFTLLADERFVHLAQWISDVPRESLKANRELISLLQQSHLDGSAVSSIVLDSRARVAPLAIFMTGWTVAIEGALAVTFLIPDSRPAATIRNSLLLLFGTTTYILAPVRGFGWVLMLLGIGQCEQRDRIFRPLYLAAIILIEFYTLPIGDLALGWLGLPEGLPQ